MQAPVSTLILGIGNILWADEGFGVRTVEMLHRHYAFPANVSVLDGGTQGIYLVQHVRAADLLVVFDAIDYGLPPGTLKLIEGDSVPKYLGAKKMSLHQTGFQEVLAMAEMLGGYPELHAGRLSAVCRNLLAGEGTASSPCCPVRTLPRCNPA